MWEKYKFEWNFKRLRGQRRRAKDDAKKAEKKKNNYPSTKRPAYFLQVFWRSG